MPLKFDDDVVEINEGSAPEEPEPRRRAPSRAGSKRGSIFDKVEVVKRDDAPATPLPASGTVTVAEGRGHERATHAEPGDAKGVLCCPPMPSCYPGLMRWACCSKRRRPGRSPAEDDEDEPKEPKDRGRTRRTTTEEAPVNHWNVSRALCIGEDEPGSSLAMQVTKRSSKLLEFVYTGGGSFKQPEQEKSAEEKLAAKFNPSKKDKKSAPNAVGDEFLREYVPRTAFLSSNVIGFCLSEVGLTMW